MPVYIFRPTQTVTNPYTGMILFYRSWTWVQHWHDDDDDDDDNDDNDDNSNHL